MDMNINIASPKKKKKEAKYDMSTHHNVLDEYSSYLLFKHSLNMIWNLSNNFKKSWYKYGTPFLMKS